MQLKKKQIIYWKFELEQWIVDEIIIYSIWRTVKEEVKQYMLVVKSGLSLWKELKNIYWEEKEKKEEEQINFTSDFDNMTFNEEE